MLKDKWCRASVYLGIRRQTNCMEFSSLSPFLSLKFGFFPLFSPHSKGLDMSFCFSLLRQTRHVLVCPVFALWSLWHPRRLWRCRCRHTCQTGATGDSLLQGIPQPCASPAAGITQAFGLRWCLFLCPPWFKLVTSITYPQICKVRFMF